MRKKRIMTVKTLIVCFSIIMLSGLNSMGYGGIMSSSKVTSSSPQTIQQAQSQAYGTKPTLAVMEFENKTGKEHEWSLFGGGRQTFGSGLKEQLVTALAQTNAFILVERDAIKDIIGEQDFGASGRVKGNTASAIGEIEGANFLIYGAITEFEGNQAGGGGGFGGITGSVIGGIASAFKQDHIAIDLRIVDSRTGRILNATSVEGKSRDLGGAIGGRFGSALMGIGGHYKNPLQKAVRACMIRAVNWIADNLMEKPAYAGPPPHQQYNQVQSQPIRQTQRPAHSQSLVPQNTQRASNKPVAQSQPIKQQKSEPDYEKKLNTLKKLKDKGLITEEEYNESRKEILKELVK